MSSQRKADLFKPYSLKRVRPSAAPGEFMAELHVLRDGKWVVIGVLQLTENEWIDLSTLYRDFGFEVTEEMKA